MKTLRTLVLPWTSVAALFVSLVGSAGAQESPAPAGTVPANNAQQTPPPASPVLRLTFEDALVRARKNSTQFLAAQTDAAIVRQDRYQAAAAQQKLEAAKKNGDEGDSVLKLTQDLERGGEVAHADVIKAVLQVQDRHRQLLEAQLGLLNALLDFAVLIFPDFNDNFELAEELHASVPLPTLAEVQQRATRDNPDLRAALAVVQQAHHDVTGARAGYLP